MVYEQVYEPVAGSLELSALVAAIPIFVASFAPLLSAKPVERCVSEVRWAEPSTLQLWGSFLEPTALFREPGALSGPADSDGREDDHKRDDDGVYELPDQGAPSFAEDHGEQVLDSCVPCQGRHES